MKRFAVLFGMLAVVVASSYATAPQVRDVPDIRLGELGAGSGLPVQATEAYDVTDYFTDTDQAPAELTVSILNTQLVRAPGAIEDATDAALIDMSGYLVLSGSDEYLVDVYPPEGPGWTQYRVQVTDSTATTKGVVGDAAISDTAIAKMSTFALNAPTVDDGVLLKDGGETATTRQFVYVWVGQGTGELYRLDTAILPESASDDVNWSIYLSDVVYDSTSDNYDANGRWIGIDFPALALGGTAANDGGLFYEIDANGMLRLTAAGSVSRGPWMVGIYAANDANTNDSDGSRVLIGAALVPEASPETATLGTSTTFDDLAVATIPAAIDYYIVTSNTPQKTKTLPVSPLPPLVDRHIAPNSGWMYQMQGNDNVLDSVDLYIVDLASEADLPDAAKAIFSSPDASVAQIAGGMGLKATMEAPTLPPGARGIYPDTTHQQLDGFRLVSRNFTGIEPTDVIQFTLSVATDAQSATDLPKYQMALASGFGGTVTGKDIRYVSANYYFHTLLEGGYEFSQVDLPTADQGWHTLSITHSPSSSNMWNDADGNGTFDETDLDLLQQYVGDPQGWNARDENSVVSALFVCSTHQYVSGDVTIWMDNFKVFRSAYALDLALGSEELDDVVVASPSYDPEADPPTGLVIDYLTKALGDFSGPLDGTFESATGATQSELLDIGFFVGKGGGGLGMFHHPEKTYIDGSDCVSLERPANPGDPVVDHTMNAGSNTSLKVVLTGDDGDSGWDGDLDSIRAQINTAVVAGQGDGMYAVEAYVSKLNASNSEGTYRDPSVRVILGEVLPNAASTVVGYILTLGGLPESVNGTPPYNWQRCIAQMYIPNCEYLRGQFQILETFQAPAINFQVPIFIDDVKLYKVGDPAMFFDADLFDEDIL